MNLNFSGFLHLIPIAYTLFSSTAALGSIVGYGSSDAVYSAKNQEFFFIGYSLGFNATIKKSRSKEFGKQLIKQVADKSPLGATRSAKALISMGAKVLVGFPTSHESLLVSELVKDKNLLFFSVGSSHSKMGSYGSNIFTLGESTEESKKKLISFVKTIKANARILHLTDRRYVFSINQTHVIEKLAKTNEIDEVSIEFVDLNSNGNLSEQVVQKLRRKEYDFISVSMYADNSIPLMEQLISANIAVPLITNSSWTIGDLDRVRRLLLEYKSEVYCVASVIKGNSSSKYFEDLYSSKYQRNPETEMYYGFDLGRIIAKVINRVEGSVSLKSFKNAFFKNPCFSGLTTGKICFDSKGGFSQRKIHWLKFSRSGLFEPTKEGG